jgi:long-subunit fatty acid transport protein
MKRVSLVLAIAALSVPAAAGAAQTSDHASPSKASVSKVKIYGTVKAINSATVTVTNATKTRTFVRRAVSLAGIHTGNRVEAEGFMRNGKLRLSGIHLDDRAAATAVTTQSGTATPVSDDPPGDDRGGQTVTVTTPSDDPPGDDRGGHGLDDAPGHH